MKFNDKIVKAVNKLNDAQNEYDQDKAMQDLNNLAHSIQRFNEDLDHKVDPLLHKMACNKYSTWFIIGPLLLAFSAGVAVCMHL